MGGIVRQEACCLAECGFERMPWDDVESRRRTCEAPEYQAVMGASCGGSDANPSGEDPKEGELRRYADSLSWTAGSNESAKADGIQVGLTQSATIGP